MGGYRVFGLTILLSQPSSRAFSFLIENHGMVVHARMEAKPDGPPDGPGHLPLVYRPQSGLLAVLDPAHLGDEVGDDREVLF
jgi:hypothetical protein